MRLPLIVLFSFFFSALALPPQALGLELEKRDLITDPAVSGRCQRLLRQRDEKIQMRQRLRSLLRRNNNLLKRTPQQKQSIVSRLKFTQTQIENNLRLSELKLQKMEENIVRRGCPGVSL